MSAYFHIQSDAPGSSPLVLVNGPPYSPWVLVGKDFGNPSWTHAMGAARGTQGRQPASGSPDDRVATFGLLSDGHASKDALAADLSSLVAVGDEVRRFGGTITFREHGQTYRNTLAVMVGSIEIGEWPAQEYELRHAQRPLIRAVCAPYVQGAIMDVADGFDSTVSTSAGGDYTADAGALANVLAAGGELTAAANLGTENRLIHTGLGYTMGDVEVQAKFTPGSTLTSYKAGVIVARLDSANYAEVFVDDTGAASRISLRQVVIGTPTVVAGPTGITRIVAGTPFWIRLRLQGALAFYSYYTSDPASLSPDVAGDAGAGFVISSVLVAAQGRAGLVWTPQHSAARADDFTVRPFLRSRTDVAGAQVSSRRWRGVIPGDAPALADLTLEVPTAASGYRFGLFGWWAAPSPHNLLDEGGFELAPTGNNAWTAANVASFIGAATSITRTTAGPVTYGRALGRVVCPATANTGAKCRVIGTFYVGETYTARVWLRAPSGSTTTARLRVGAIGDIASSTPVTLSATWTEHVVTWTPTADRQVVYFGAEITAATGTTFDIDAAQFYRGTVQPTVGLHAQGQGARPPFGVLEAESAWQTLFGVETSDANQSGGLYLADASGAGAGETWTAYWMIDPGLVQPDDYAAGSVSFTAFARVKLHAADTGGMRALLQAYPATAIGGSVVVNTQEYNVQSKALVIPSSGAAWRTTRLGTIVLPPSSGRWALVLTMILGPGTNAQETGLDYVALLPTRNHVLSPTGKSATGYPSLLPTSSSYLKRVVRSDLTGLVAAGLDPLMTAPALCGNGGIELPARKEIETLTLVSSDIPDTPTNTLSSETFERARVHLAVTPRWSYLRETS